MTDSMALEQDNNRAFETKWKERLCLMAKAPKKNFWNSAASSAHKLGSAARAGQAAQSGYMS